jgi:uncharacterized membrane protein
MRRRLSCEQRGAISVLAGISLVVVVASAALTVDVGQAAWQKRSLQRLVDVVSLDAVRAVGDRRDTTADPLSAALAFARASALRNEFDYADASQGNALQVELGVADPATKAFTPITDPARYATANAVRVTAWHRTDHRFMPGSMTLAAQAVAMVESRATFSVGSRLARLDTTTSPILNAVLRQMLGSGVTLDAVAYNNLLGATVALGDVWTRLGLGSPDQILNTAVNVRSFLTATAAALNNQGDPASLAAASTLGTLATQVSTTLSFRFGDMLQLATGNPGDAANARMDVLGLVGMAAQLANGDNLMTLTLPLAIPGVASTQLKLGLIEKPVIASGPVGTTARTAQARMQLTLTLLQTLNLLLTQIAVKLPIYLEAAGATGTLRAIRCAVPKTSSDITVGAATRTVTAKVGQATDSSLTDPSRPADVRDAEIANAAGLIRVTGRATATMPGSAADLVIPLYDVRSVGGASPILDSQLLSNLSLTVQVLGLGIDTGQVLSDLLGILRPVLDILDGALFDPLGRALGALGIEIGGADVSNLDETCGSRRLIG